MINATFGTAFEALNSLFSPYPLLPYPIMVTRGVSDIWLAIVKEVSISELFSSFHFSFQPPEFVTRLVLNSGMFCTMFLVYSTTSMFVYRYWQTTQQQELLRLASNMKLYVLSYVVVGIVCGLLMFLPINLQLLSNNELQEGIRRVDPKTFEKMQGHISIGFNVS